MPQSHTNSGIKYMNLLYKPTHRNLCGQYNKYHDNNFFNLFHIAQSHWITLFSHKLKITWDWRRPPNICWIIVVSWALRGSALSPSNSASTADCIVSIANLPSRQLYYDSTCLLTYNTSNYIIDLHKSGFHVVHYSKFTHQLSSDNNIPHKLMGILLLSTRKITTNVRQPW